MEPIKWKEELTESEILLLLLWGHEWTRGKMADTKEMEAIKWTEKLTERQILVLGDDPYYAWYDIVCNCDNCEAKKPYWDRAYDRLKLAVDLIYPDYVGPKEILSPLLVAINKVMIVLAGRIRQQEAYSDQDAIDGFMPTPHDFKQVRREAGVKYPKRPYWHGRSYAYDAGQFDSCRQAYDLDRINWPRKPKFVGFEPNYRNESTEHRFHYVTEYDWREKTFHPHSQFVDHVGPDLFLEQGQIHHSEYDQHSQNYHVIVSLPVVAIELPNDAPLDLALNINKSKKRRTEKIGKWKHRYYNPNYLYSVSPNGQQLLLWSKSTSWSYPEKGQQTLVHTSISRDIHSFKKYILKWDQPQPLAGIMIRGEAPTLVYVNYHQYMSRIKHAYLPNQTQFQKARGHRNAFQIVCQPEKLGWISSFRWWWFDLLSRKWQLGGVEKANSCAKMWLWIPFSSSNSSHPIITSQIRIEPLNYYQNVRAELIVIGHPADTTITKPNQDNQMDQMDRNATERCYYDVQGKVPAHLKGVASKKIARRYKDPWVARKHQWNWREYVYDDMPVYGLNKSYDVNNDENEHDLL